LHRFCLLGHFKERDMHSFTMTVVVVTLAGVVSANGAAAQEAASAVEQPKPNLQYMLAFGASTGTVPATILRLEDPERTALERKVRRNRRALIGTSVAVAVGLPLWVVGTKKHCSRVEFGRATELTCSKTGKVARGTGMTLFWGGASGMLISGIMIAVRKGQLRDLGYRVEYPKSRALRWDAASSQFVF